MDRLIEKALDAAAMRPNLVRLVEDARIDFDDAEEILDALISNLAGAFYDVDMDDVQYKKEILKRAMQKAADENEELQYRNDADMTQRDDHE